MKIRSIFASGIFAAFLGVLLFSACDKEKLPTADFIFTVDGLTVTFDNFSKDADSYLWDFGDGNTSTETDPVHAYTDEGTYTVKLTAKNSDGEDTYSESIAVTRPAITVNSDFSDWESYDVYYSDPDGLNGSMRETKVVKKGGFLYFYVKADAATAGPVIQVFIDKDNNGETGWAFWNKYETPGLEYLIEYVIEDFTGAYGPASMGSTAFEATADDWPWTIQISDAAVTETSGWVTKGNVKEIEFSVPTSLMPDLASTVRMAFSNSNNDWEDAGAMPIGWQDPPLPLLPITLD